MKLTKKLEADILKAYNEYWDAYLKGDMRTMSYWMHENVRMIGSGRGEFFENKKKTLKYYKGTAKQIAGKADMRNRKISVSAVGDNILVNEECDFFVLIDSTWTFYGEGRISTLFTKTNKGWKIIQEHGSMPDARTSEGEQVNTNKIKAENIRLKDAVKRRTVELEDKNHELEIESSLERVRTVAMGMKKPEDMLKVCKTISQQLQKLGVKEIRNIQTAIFYEQQGTYMNYQYYAKHNKTFITDTIYTDHKVARDFAAQMLKGKGKFSITHIKGRKKLKDWITYQKNANVFSDKYLHTAASLSYYWYSLGPVALGISTYFPLTEEEDNLFKRFLNVFELAYRRYLDIEKAEAQAREAEIELALERVRARGMTMQTSEELGALVGTLFTELTKLDLVLTRCVIRIIDPKTNDAIWWLANSEDPSRPMSYFISYHQQPPWLAFLKEWKKRTIKWVYDLKGQTKKNWDDYLFSKTGLSKVPGFVQKGMRDPERILLSTTFSNFGGMSVASLEPLPDEHYNILLRFAKVFDLTYTRFNDLKQAEAQARESEIQLALERVRARTMSMQKSEELKETTLVLFQQFKSLGATTAQVSICIFDEETKMGEMFVTLRGEKIDRSFPMEIDKASFVMKRAKKAFLNDQKTFSVIITGKELQNYNHWRNLLIGKKGWDESHAVRKQSWYVNAVFFSRGMMGISSDSPPSDEALKLLERFGNVFAATYTRFNDLKKAETQAREARMEGALEKIRSSSLAMHSSDEMQGVVNTVIEQLQKLNIVLDTTNILIFNDSDKSIEFWTGSNSTGAQLTTSWRVPYFNISYYKAIHKAHGQEQEIFTANYSFKEKNKLFTHLFANTDFKNLNGERKKFILKSPGATIVAAIVKDTAIQVISYTRESFSEDEIEILKRFSRVFNQAYTRFLDLQKAEAQAREAQIEAGLERVRSRSLAMHNTSELQAVIHTVHKELLHLNIAIDGGSFIAINSDIKTQLRCWGSGGTADTWAEVVLPLYEKPFCSNLINGIKKRSGFFTEEFTQQEKKGFFTFLFKHEPWSKLDTKQKKEILSSPGGYTRSCSVSQHTSIFIINHLGKKFSAADNDILQRFGKVFEQSYTRFLDLQKAEAQARESQIQLALERVRARTMAMQKSEELKEVIQLILEQFVHLGLETEAAGFMIDYKDSNDINVWVSSPRHPLATQIHIPYFDHPIFKLFVEAKEKGFDFYTVKLTKKEKDTFFTHIFQQLPGFPEEWKQQMYAAPGYADSHVMLNNIALYIQNYTGIPYSDVDNAILMRFAKAFEQTYTRFLDLKKAEAQAREAQIELGLERVRARAMAMQKSDELSELVDTVFKELTKLDFALTWCIINIIDESSMSNTVWAANPDINKAPESYHMLFEDYPFHDAMMKGWKERKTKYVYTLEGSEKKIYDDYLFSETEFKRTPEAAQAASRAMEKYVVSFSFSNFGGLQTVGDVPLSDANLDILSRFGKVFDLTYTRFNDLKKAEAQAREAQIELSLERVRARTMAMQKSDELREAVLVIYEQLQHLNFDSNACNIIIMNKESGSMQYWVSGFTQEIFPESYYVPYLNHPYHEAQLIPWRQGEKYAVIEISGKMKKSFDEIFFTQTEFRNIPEKAKEVMTGFKFLNFSTAYISYGALQVIGLEPLSEENGIILQRFAKVFEQTYTRFLDLQKAEAQSREAQIEAALERVRSRSIGMHKSQELKEIIKVVYEQLVHLNILVEHAGFIMDYKERDDLHIWLADQHLIPSEVTIPWFDSVPNNCIKEAKANEQDSFKYLLAFEEKNKFYRDLFKFVPDVPEETLEYYFNCPGLAGSGVLLDNVGLYIENFDGIPYTDEENAVLMRFGKVFQQTYTRFLDLQKAEAQSRESQIQLGLERVRARAMAMQKSGELKELIGTVFIELTKLDLVLTRCLIMIYDPQTNGSTWWMANSETPTDPIGLYVKNHQLPPYAAYIKAWQERENKWQYILEGSDKKEWDDFLFVETELSQLPDFVITGMKAPDRVYLNASFNSFGNLTLATLEPLSDEHSDILLRFAKVFDLTYTRFNDLQKAEAQAREAKIEAAMERTRTQTMIMQHSKELDDVLRVFHEQVLLLGIHSAFSFLWLPDEDKDRHIFWAAWAENDSTVFKSKAINYPLDRNEPATAQCLVDWKSNTAVYSYHVPPAAVENYFAVWQELIDGVDQLKPEYFSGGLYYVEAFMKYGCFGVMIENDLKEAEKKILLRFSNEFERTYTRFLDLQKAEAQAREAKIEAALEKVRSRSLAMHKSEELHEVVTVVFNRMKELDITMDAVNINIFYKGNRDVDLWVASPGQDYAACFHLPYIDLAIPSDIFNAKERGDDFFAKAYSFDEKNQYFNYLFTHSDFKHLPENRKNKMLAGNAYAVSIAFTKNAGISIHSYSGKLFSDEENDILKRFTKVFEQAHIRFLDLQKAEMQTREAQIEAALEKVRGRSLAMHKSGELQDVVNIVFENVQGLGIKIDSASLIVLSDITDLMQYWVAVPGQSYSRYFLIPYIDSTTISKDFILARKSGVSFIKSYTGEEKNEQWNFLFEHSELKELPEDRKKFLLESAAYTVCVNFTKNTALQLLRYEEPGFTEKESEIFQRFANVFEQAYTRFLDLQKAEAQAREAQIEAALERVRARTMAMHNSEDVSAATATMFTELEKLGIENLRCGITIIHKNKTQEVWSVSNTTGDSVDDAVRQKKIVLAAGTFDMNAHPLWRLIYDKWDNKEDFVNYFLAGKDKEDYFKILNTTKGYLPQTIQEFPDTDFQVYFFGEGAVWSCSLQPHSEEQKQIMKRFTSVFSLTFRRYQDLQKAEAQTRESQIQLALERVRARTMAMQKSEELAETAAVLFQQMNVLGDTPERLNIGIVKEEEGFIETWATEQGGNQINQTFISRLSEPTTIAKLFEGWKAQKKSMVVDLSGNELKQWIHYLQDELKIPLREELLRNRRVQTVAYFKQGFILMTTPEPLPVETINLLERFAEVFNLTYTRFLDLKNAEAQAKEAQIEAGLERVRSRAMSMQSSEEVNALIGAVFTELTKLDLILTRCVIWIYEGNEKGCRWWMANSEAPDMPMNFFVKYADIPFFNEHLKEWYDRALKWQYVLEAENKIKTDDFLFNETELSQLPDFVIAGMRAPQRVYLNASFNNFGNLTLASLKPLSDKHFDILLRFAKVFDLTYTRFNDLKNAEASAKEAIKQATLDRIRADIASMRTTKDLERITPLIWNELTILGVPFIRCGVFIMDEAEQLIHTFLSSPDGKAIAAFHLPYTTPGNISFILQGWREKKNYIDHWDEQTFTDFAHTLVQQGALTSIDEYMKTLPKGGFYLHFLPFLQGMLYVGNSNRLGEEEINLLQSVADAFSTAYARYEDFNKLEAAKKQVDSTLTELQSTQKQLIQSEKMASLGELTAGIAHEIQNPLNFVNNFSEVSTELIDEMKEELAKSNYEDANAIADDLKQNLEKINHHGKRAGDIVKGMLQHSRTSTGQKELTDINVLCDEYLRLSYHGLRAKDKSFNAKFESDFDNSIEKINVVPQDIGRVILNLINNAFYAAPLPPKGGFREPDGKHVPTIWVSTKKEDSKVLISVRDNGPGIPKEIMDKIFQPFFTTKPTGQGTGLGLSLSYDIIKAHGGEIKVETKEGEGTEFTLALPIAIS